MTKEIRPGVKSIYPAIESYAEQGVDTRDIRALVYIDKGEIFTTKQISTAITKARRAHKLPPQSVDERSRANAGRKKIIREEGPIEPERVDLKIWEEAWPFYLRGGIPSEISPIIDRSSGSVKSAVSHQRKHRPHDNYRFQDNIDVKKRKILIKKRAAMKNEEPSENEKASVDLVKALIPDKTLSKNLEVWEMLKKIGDDLGRPWTEELAYGLVLEKYIEAEKARIGGDGHVLEDYINMGNSVDSEWFNSAGFTADRKAIKSKLEEPLAHDLHKPLAVRGASVEQIMQITSSENIPFENPERNAILFARELNALEMIHEEPVFWEFTKKIAENEGLDWFGEEGKFSFKGIIMEAWVIAHYLKATDKKSGIWQVVQKLGRDISSYWFDVRMKDDLLVAENAVLRKFKPNV